jgi:hypothetical protein
MSGSGTSCQSLRSIEMTSFLNISAVYSFSYSPPTYRDGYELEPAHYIVFLNNRAIMSFNTRQEAAKFAKMHESLHNKDN